MARAPRFWGPSASGSTGSLEGPVSICEPFTPDAFPVTQ